MAITPAHRELLEAAAISAEVIESSGIQSGPKGDTLMFPWSDGTCPTVWQSRPDSPAEHPETGRPMKYVFPKGARIPLNRLRDSETTTRAIIAEGTKQSYAVLSHAPADMAVYGLAGCNNFQHTDLSIFNGKAVYLLLDADFRTNPDVYASAEALTDRLRLGGAKSVEYVSTPGSGKEGVDDVLAKVKPEQRAEDLRRWLSLAADKLGKRPKGKRPVQSEMDQEAAKLFGVRDKPLSYKPVDGARKIMAETPAAITREGVIALYRDGVYQIDKNALLARVVGLLGNFYTPSFMTQTTDVLTGMLADAGRVLPEQMTQPLLNCPNGMVDLRNGKVIEHDPDFMSYVQVQVAYQPDMPTPVYDAWLREALRGETHSDADVDALVADIEETAGTMLDPTRTPSKTLFLFGPSRSGKSTFLRLLTAVAGPSSTSAVTLHNLATDTFAAANLYGKMLNVAADLSNKHVADLSLFKMITGEDVIQANRKYGSQFQFTNQALVAFSANELPTVSEASRAYAERMKPFEFPNSFAGREDKTLEAKLRAELPGILARWVKAYSRFLARGGYAPTDAATLSEFEAKSDRVNKFFQDMCSMTEAHYGDTMSSGTATPRAAVHVMFNAWAKRNGSSEMGQSAFFSRFESVTGVTLVKLGRSDKAYNVTVRAADMDVWSDMDAVGATGVDEPVADPVAPSGVDLSMDLAASSWPEVAQPGGGEPAPSAGMWDHLEDDGEW